MLYRLGPMALQMAGWQRRCWPLVWRRWRHSTSRRRFGRSEIAAMLYCVTAHVYTTFQLAEDSPFSLFSLFSFTTNLNYFLLYNTFNQLYLWPVHTGECWSLLLSVITLVPFLSSLSVRLQHSHAGGTWSWFYIHASATHAHIQMLATLVYLIELTNQSQTTVSYACQDIRIAVLW